ncbi:hypothetical protein [Propionivibrio sp.]|uniref:hypothetical protein n=1 Tax=Propionivibrio sp. TaxID=2212460 RepID=UPI0025FC1C90|nr:hypothetical protein [Propionivibrio sp.]MBK8745822.1 hypothetical protein [Propionivibrio sp.]MBK8893423.1 hypothetical protein [Propionivibrio sp.]
MNKPNCVRVLIGVLGFLALSGCAQNTLAARLVDVTLVNRSTGERLTPYHHHGKLYIAGTPGDHYAIELRNNRSERLLTVLSVDGINALTGQTASALQSGYVLDGGQRYGISGWRKSMDDVAQFVFTALPNSYAARTGRPDNVGVIGVAVYREKVLPPPTYPGASIAYPATGEPRRSESVRDLDEGPARQAANAPAAKSESAESSGLGASGALADRRADQADKAVAAPPEFEKKAKRLGTGHGEREYSPTRYTGFERASDTPDEIITLYYDSRSNLVARGIIPSPRLAEPQPFPLGNRFVPDPHS